MWDYITKRIGKARSKSESSDIHAPKNIPPFHKTDAISSETENQKKEDDSHQSKTQKTRRLHCPVCSTLMVIKYIGNAMIDQCPDCDGIFLDKGELQTISGTNLSSYEKTDNDDSYLIYTPHGLSEHVRLQD